MVDRNPDNPEPPLCGPPKFQAAPPVLAGQGGASVEGYHSVLPDGRYGVWQASLEHSLQVLTIGLSGLPPELVESEPSQGWGQSPEFLREREPWWLEGCCRQPELAS
ncbi:uncharacterized protein METZ01_LOCUS459665 [marine metagenome]|uniref:Uncharacterized protein n=1 Tax=marine metagenome TaxID=408172 RepID=A0A383AGT5_9ZZZZ